MRLRPDLRHVAAISFIALPLTILLACDASDPGPADASATAPPRVSAAKATSGGAAEEHGVPPEASAAPRAEVPDASAVVANTPVTPAPVASQPAAVRVASPPDRSREPVAAQPPGSPAAPALASGAVRVTAVTSSRAEPSETAEVNAAPVLAEAETAPTPPSHAAFSALLKRHVSAGGRVDYAGLKRDRAELDAYLASLAANAPTDSWSRNERLAYWINAYNAATLALIVENYPLASITKLDGGKPWDVKRVRLGDRTYSLNEIENDVIRPRFREPRIHFAVNCAAASCPPLRNEAFVASKLDAQLEEQTRNFLRDARSNRVEGQTLVLSKIFDWYGEDFDDLTGFVGRYVEVPPGAEVRYDEYDWSLNGR